MFGEGPTGAAPETGPGVLVERKPLVLHVVVVPTVVVELHDVTVVVQVVEATLSGKASPTTAFSWPAIFSNPIPTTDLALEIIAFAFATSDAAICCACSIAADTMAWTVDAMPSMSIFASAAWGNAFTFR